MSGRVRELDILHTPRVDDLLIAGEIDHPRSFFAQFLADGKKRPLHTLRHTCGSHPLATGLEFEYRLASGLINYRYSSLISGENPWRCVAGQRGTRTESTAFRPRGARCRISSRVRTGRGKTEPSETMAMTNRYGSMMLETTVRRACSLFWFGLLEPQEPRRERPVQSRLESSCNSGGTQCRQRSNGRMFAVSLP